MYYRTIRNDILRNKAITLTIMIFVAAAAMLVSLAAILVVNLSGAIDTLMTRAKTPHFMQMHSGEMDSARLAAFVEQHSEIVDYQVLEFLNIDGAQIVFEERSLAGSVQDNGFSVQSEKFDYLLDLDGNIIHVSDGEIYVPIPYMQEGLANVGDKVQVSGKEFTVAGFLRDSQMNSLLSSSKRFLVSENDYAEIRDFGSVEYLIEFRLNDLSALGAFETAYTSAGLEANGPTITYPLFKMLNSLSDGLMIAVILLISALVDCRRVPVHPLHAACKNRGRLPRNRRDESNRAARFRHQENIPGKIRGDCGIGLAYSDLRFRLHFGACCLKISASIWAKAKTLPLPCSFGIISVLLVFLAIIAYVNGVLGRFRKIPPAEAIRFGISQEKPSGGKHFRLSMNRLLGTNVFLGMKDVLARKKIYATMLAVLVIAAFIIIVPQNLHNTISSNDFITYMGIGNSDLRIDIQQTDNISEKAAEIAAAHGE